MSYKVMNTTAIDISNKKYNRLLALRPTDKRQSSSVVWECICDCRNITFATIWQLKSGGKKSCGCLKEEAFSKTSEEHNKTHRLAKGMAARNQVYSRYRREAIKRGLSFDLSIEEFAHITTSNCFYDNKPPMQEHFGKSMNGTYLYNGIDRLDNNKGYSIDNCVPCCWSCNQMKADRSPEQFINDIKAILDNFLSKEQKELYGS